MNRPAAVVWIPGAPILVPEVATGARADVDHVRRAALGALRGALRDARRVQLLGAGRDGGVMPAGSCGSLAGVGVPRTVTLPGRDATGDEPVVASGGPTHGRLPGGTKLGDVAGAPGGQRELPLSLTVGACLLEEAWQGDPLAPPVLTSAVSISSAAPEDRPSGEGDPFDDGALVVVADGSTHRPAPDGRPASPAAEDWDRRIGEALDHGDAGFLATLDEGAAAAVGCRDTHVWRFAGRHLPGPWLGELILEDAPLGVGYFVAVWRRP